MLAYHGTTRMRARNIFEEGFLPKPPSRRVWFAEARAYAMGRAKTQARRAADEPVVLACNVDLDRLEKRLGAKKVFYRKGIIAIDGGVPVDMLLPHPFADLATVPEEVADWVNELLGLEEGARVDAKHAGAKRLSRWINSQVATEPETKLLCSEVLEKARRWLPEYFAGTELDAKDLKVHRRVGFTDYELDPKAVGPDPREAEALECLEDPNPKQRIRGLSLLADICDPDIFEWCAMFAVEDEDATVQAAALRTMLRCEGGSPEIVVPFANAEDRLLRAAAIAALVKHSGDEAPTWVHRGLKDPEPCVRVEAARFLGDLDARDHRATFELAELDPNPDIARRAREVFEAKKRERAKSRPLRG